MKTILRALLFVLLLTPGLRAGVAPAAPAGKLYVAIDTFEPIKFNTYRYGRAQPGDLVLSTLKATAAASAKLAELSDEIVVLDEGASAPAGARVLRLTWTDGRNTVTADLTENGHNHYLGVVSRKEIPDHPEHQRLLRTVMSAVTADAQNDATVQVRTEMNLYFALKLAAAYHAGAAKS